MTKYDRLCSEMQNLSCTKMPGCSKCPNFTRCDELSKEITIESDFIRAMELRMLYNLDQLILNLEVAE